VRGGAGALALCGPLDDTHDVVLFHDQQVLAVDFDFRAGPLSKQDLIAGLDVERDQFAGLVALAWPDR
jgi:hypothetical protein